MTAARARRALAAAGGGLALALLLAASAAAAPTVAVSPCVAGDKTITITGDPSPPTIAVSAAGEIVTVNGTPEAACTGLDSIAITSDGAAHHVTYTGSLAFTVDVDLGGGADTFVASGTQPVDVDGGEDGDTITGAGGADILTGGPGNDTLVGAAGMDALDGGLDDDLLRPGTGTGVSTGGGGADTVSYVDVAPVALPGTTVTATLGVGANATVAGSAQTLGADIENLTGSLGKDVLNGSGGPNVLRGLAGEDALTGGPGDDLLVPGSGAGSNAGGDGTEDRVSFEDVAALPAPAFTVTATLGGNADVAGSTQSLAIDIENMTGSAGRDVLVGTPGENDLDGGDGDDVLRPLGGGGTNIGGGGTEDRVSYQDVAALAPGTVTVSATLGGGATVGASTQTLDADIENLTGSPGDDVLVGTPGENDLDGGSADGNDVLRPLGGAGTNVGGGGVDTLSFEDLTPAAAPALTVDATIGVTATVPGGVQSVAADIENLTGSEGDDELTGSPDPNVLRGLGGDDVLDGAGASDLLRPGTGGGSSTGGGGSEDRVSFQDVPALAPGTVTVSATLGASATIGASTHTLNPGIENLTGSPGDDVLIGTPGENDLDGGAGDGNDVLRPLGGTGTNIGGGGSEDRVSYQDVPALAAPAVTVNATLGASANVAGSVQSLAADIENLTGSPGNDVLTGTPGENDLDGEDGDDVLHPLGGAGINTGGGGSGDTVTYEDVVPALPPATTITATLGGSADVAGSTQSLAVDIENLTGSAGDDVLTGSTLANVLRGLAGADTLSGGDGNDLLVPGGGGGANVGGEGTEDHVSYADIAALAPPAITVDATLGANAEVAGSTQSLAADIENLTGSPGRDVLVGTPTENDLDGGDENDVLRPGAGTGTNVGGGGIDTLSYEDVAALPAPAITVDATLGATAEVAGSTQSLAADIENLTGSAGDDDLTGEPGPNLLRGLAGNDALDGAGGDDVLMPGIGAGSNVGGGGTEDRVSFADVGALAPPAVTVDATLGANANVAGSVQSLAADVENMTGSPGDDVLVGTPGENDLDGGDGDDVLHPLGGTGTNVGGEGVDTVTYEDVAALPAPAVTVSATLGANANVAGSIQSLAADIENLTGSAGNDVLVGQGGANVLRGLAGQDGLDGAGANDVLMPGIGAGSNVGGGGSEDRVSFVDVGALAPPAVTVDATLGANANVAGSIQSLAADIENMTGSPGNDILVGTPGENDLDGGGGDDVLRPLGGTGTNTGGGGSEDRVSYQDVPALPAPAVTVSATLGASATVSGSTQSLAADIENLTGSPGDDVLIGTHGENDLDGGAGDGNDVLRPLGGTGTNAGGGGSEDRVSYQDVAALPAPAVTVSATLGGSADVAGSTQSLAADIENLTGSPGDDVLIGTHGENDLDGGAGDGNDVLRPLGGTGTNIGGGGSEDRVSYQDVPALAAPAVTVNATLGASANVAGSVQSLAADIENLTGSPGNDVLTGTPGENDLDGGDGDDLLRPGAGAGSTTGGGGAGDTVSYDTIAALPAPAVTLRATLGGSVDVSGSTQTLAADIENLTGTAGIDELTGSGADNVIVAAAGDDTLAGAGGADHLAGDAGSDTVSYASASGAVVVRLDGLPGDGVAGEGDNVVGTENIVGSPANDELFGNAAVNTFDAGPGEDLLVGGGGGDTLDGGADDDTASYQDRGPGDGVRATLEGAAGGGAAGEGDIFVSVQRLRGGAGDDELIGNIDDNDLQGGAGADVLDGASGGDVLRGGAGPDTLLGGPGADALDGGAGNDRLEGGTEPDHFDGDAGDDTINSFDGLAETVVCGAGTDAVDHDLSDALAADCEQRTLLGFVPPPFDLDPRARDRDNDRVFAPPAGLDCNDKDPGIRPGAPDSPATPADENCDKVNAPFPLITTEFRVGFGKRPTGTRIRRLELRKVPANTRIEVTCKSGRSPRCVFRTRIRTIATRRPLVSVRGFFGDRPLGAGATVELRVSAPQTIGRSISFTTRKDRRSPKRTFGCLAVDTHVPQPCP